MLSQAVLRCPHPGNALVARGDLDGVTLLRYAHIYRERASGGIEQYLRNLDRSLLERHRMTILQMHLTRDERSGVEVEEVGLGRIVWVPVYLRCSNSKLLDLPAQMNHVAHWLREQSRDDDGSQQRTWPVVQSFFRHLEGQLRYRATILSDHLSGLLLKYKVDLLALHWISYETGALMSSARRAHIPIALINHFRNDRFRTAEMRSAVMHANAVGAVSQGDVPDYLEGRCVHLSDAVDMSFFALEKARPLQSHVAPMVLLPARIQRGKGHYDLIAATRILKSKGIEFSVCMAGAVDSKELEQELRLQTESSGLGRDVSFIGEISAEELRDLYAASSIVILPSYAEGLPRVLLEAQAMQRPVIAYRAGGIPEAVLPGESGFLVKRGDVEGLANRIGLLLQSEAMRLRMGECGRRFVTLRFSVPALIARHEAFYRQVLSASCQRAEGLPCA